MDLDRLGLALQQCPYPPEIGHVDRGLRGWGFYPAARGYSASIPPENGIMLLGRDWGARAEYETFLLTEEQSETGLTSRRTQSMIMPLLERYGVWRTNYLPGLRIHRPSNGNLKNRIEAASWTQYEEFAWGFLQKQVLLQKPRLIVVLGLPNAEDLATDSRFVAWDPDGFFLHNFYDEGCTYTTSVAFLDHPFSISNKIVRLRFDHKLEAIANFIASNVADL